MNTSPTLAQRKVVLIKAAFQAENNEKCMKHAHIILCGGRIK